MRQLRLGVKRRINHLQSEHLHGYEVCNNFADQSVSISRIFICSCYRERTERRSCSACGKRDWQNTEPPFSIWRAQLHSHRVFSKELLLIMYCTM